MSWALLLMQSFTLFHKGFRSFWGMRDPGCLHRPWREPSPCTAQSLKEDMTSLLQLRPVKNLTAFLALSSQHPSLISSPPADTPSAPLGMALSLCQFCTSPTRPLNPKPSLSLPHIQQQFPGLESLLQPGESPPAMAVSWSRGLASWTIFILMEIRKSWGVGTSFTFLLFASFLWEHGVQPWIRGLTSHQRPTGQQQHPTSVPKEHLSVPGPCSAQEETKQMWSRGIWLLVLQSP